MNGYIPMNGGRTPSREWDDARQQFIDRLPAHAVPKPVSTPARQFDEDTGTYRQRPAPKPAAALETVSIENLIDSHPRLHDPLIDGVCRLGETVNVISTTKIGKSWFLYNVAFCVATGRALFGQFATKQGRVLLIDNELHSPTIAGRLKTVADAMGIDRSEYAGQLEVLAARGKGLDVFRIGKMLDSVDPGRFAMIAIDAKYRAMPAGTDENSNSDGASFYNEVDKIAARTGAAIILIHHSTKGGQSDKRVTDVGAGAGSQSRAADAHLVLREHEEADCVVLEAAVRSFAPVEPLALRWQFPLWMPDDSLDAGRLKGKKPSAEERQRDRNREAEGMILDACQTWRTKKELRAETGIGQERITRAISRLIDQRYLEESQAERYGNQATVYRKTIHAAAADPVDELAD